jgi:hypothetical protein
MDEQRRHSSSNRSTNSFSAQSVKS